MLTRNDIVRSAQAFTLIELILVMALLVMLLALSVPSFSGSFKARTVEQEAAQLLAATEYARNEAVSQGVPMIVWIDANTGEFGVNAKDGYEGNASREKTFALHPDLHFELAQTDTLGFEPDGTLDSESPDSIKIVSRFNPSISLSQTEDGWGYEIVKEAR